MQDAARREADLPQVPGELLVAGHHARHHVPVAAEVLGGAVQHQAGAVFRGALEHGCGEGVVREEGHRAAGVGQGAQVDFGEGGVGRGFDQDQTRVRAQGVGDPRRVGPGDLRAEESRGQQVVAAAVQGAYGDDVAQAQGGPYEKDGRERGHAAGEGDRGLGPLQPGQSGLEAGDGGVAEASVHGRAVRLGAGRREGVDAGGLAAAVVGRVGRRQVDGRGVQSLPGEVVAAGVDGLGGQCSERRTRDGGGAR